MNEEYKSDITDIIFMQIAPYYMTTLQWQQYIYT